SRSVRGPDHALAPQPLGHGAHGQCGRAYGGAVRTTARTAGGGEGSQRPQAGGCSAGGGRRAAAAAEDLHRRGDPRGEAQRRGRKVMILPTKPGRAIGLLALAALIAVRSDALIAGGGQQPEATPSIKRISLTAGRSTVISTEFDISRIAVTNPAVADAV